MALVSTFTLPSTGGGVERLLEPSRDVGVELEALATEVVSVVV